MSLWHALAALLPFQWAQYAFMRNALLAVLIVSPLFALLGCMVINRQMAFFADAIGHAGLTGVAIGALAGLADPLWAMTAFAVALALALTALRRWGSSSADTAIGIISSFSVALGIVLLSRMGGFAKYSRFLVGDILNITAGQLPWLLVTAALFLACWALFFNAVVLVSVNRSLARSRRFNVWAVETLFAALTAAVVTVSIPWVGILVINALLVLPAAASRNVTVSVRSYLWTAVIVSTVSGIAGLVASFYLGTATGGTIVLIAAGAYAVSLLMRGLRKNGVR